MSTLAPANDGQLIRQMGERLKALESGVTSRIGGFVLSDKGGTLVATSNTGAAVPLTGLPDIDIGGAISAALGSTLSNYVTATDMSKALGIYGDETNAGFESIMNGIRRWGTQNVQLDPLTRALLGVAGTISDVASWALRVPLTIGGVIVGSLIAGLDAAKIVTGQFAQSMVYGLSGVVNNVQAMLNALFNGTITQYIQSSIIPGLDAAKIVTGQFAQNMVSGLTTLQSNVTSMITSLFNGTLSSQIVAAVIPGIDAAKIITGQFAQGMVSGLTTLQSNVTSMITNLFNGTIGSQIVAAVIPGLDAAKIVTGQFAQGMVSGLTGLATSVTSLVGFLFNGTIGPVLQAMAIPGLDAAKIVTGQFAQGMVNGLTSLQGFFNTIWAWYLSATNQTSSATPASINIGATRIDIHMPTVSDVEQFPATLQSFATDAFNALRGAVPLAPNSTSIGAPNLGSIIGSQFAGTQAAFNQAQAIASNAANTALHAALDGPAYVATVVIPQTVTAIGSTISGGIQYASGAITSAIQNNPVVKWLGNIFG